MGRGQIVQELGDGYYNVQLQLEVSRLQTSREEEAETLEGVDIPTAELAVEIAEQTLVDVQTAASEMIRQYNQNPLAVSFEQVRETWKAIQAATTQLKQATNALNKMQLRLASLKKKIARYTPPEEPVVKALCVDLEKELTGLVGTIEPLGERRDDIPVLIAPGGQISSADGILQPLQAASTFGAILNLILRPAWQRWKPMFRIGNLTLIDDLYENGSVQLDEAFSSGETAIDLNQKQNLENVPLLHSDNFKFSAIDKAVVRFNNQDWNQPEIIGIAEPPLIAELVLGGISAVVGSVVWRIGPVTGGIYYPGQGFGRKCLLAIDLSYDPSEVTPTAVKVENEGYFRFDGVPLNGYTQYRMEGELSGTVLYHMLYPPGEEIPLDFTRWAPVPNYPWDSEPSEPIPVCSENWIPTPDKPWIPGENVLVTAFPKAWTQEERDNYTPLGDGDSGIQFSRVDFGGRQIRVLIEGQEPYWAEVADISADGLLPFPNEPWVTGLTGDEWVTVLALRDMLKV